MKVSTTVIIINVKIYLIGTLQMFDNGKQHDYCSHTQILKH